MTCAADIATFRLLDGLVGWDNSSDQGLELSGPPGIRLKAASPALGIIDPSELSARITPARLAHGCDPCHWYLVTPTPPKPRLMHRDSCTPGWQSVLSEKCAHGLLVDPVAITVQRDRLAVADPGAGVVWMWIRSGEKLAAKITLSNPGPLTFAPWNELIVADQDSRRLLGFDPTGDARGQLQALVPDSGIIDRIAVDERCRLWVVTRNGTGIHRLWVANRSDPEFHVAATTELKDAFPDSGVTAVSDIGFCIAEQNEDADSPTTCFSWYGRPIEASSIVAGWPTILASHGQLLTQPIDSGIPRCRWHRVRIDADVPSGTTLSVAVATNEEPDPPPQGKESDPDWIEFRPGIIFKPGIPHPSDWQVAPDRAMDFLIDQPPGRYLFLRARLTGDQENTPVVRRIRLDFPRSTSLNQLPSVYRENPDAEDFTERFLSLFDAAIEDLDQAIERYPALLDTGGVHENVLPWLGSFLDIAMDPAWDTKRRRRILKKAPELYRKRGTVAGLTEAIELVFDISPIVQELAHERNWGALRHARLGAVRLFGRGRARFRLGSSALSRTPLKSYGNPDHDPLTAQAHRFRILLPPDRLGRPTDHERLIHLVNSQKPAHTVASIRVGGQGFILGHWGAVGIDTAFTPLPPPVLGGPDLRLNRMSILGPARQGRGVCLRVGQAATVGMNTVME